MKISVTGSMSRGRSHYVFIYYCSISSHPSVYPSVWMQKSTNKKKEITTISNKHPYLCSLESFAVLCWISKFSILEVLNMSSLKDCLLSCVIHSCMKLKMIGRAHLCQGNLTRVVPIGSSIRRNLCTMILIVFWISSTKNYNKANFDYFHQVKTKFFW